MGSLRLSRRTFLAGALALPALHRAKADCTSPALRIRVSRNFKTFDPADAYGSDAIIAWNLFAPLVRYRQRIGSEKWEWQNHLASQISRDDAKTYSFTLRDNEDWTNGSALKAEDVAFSFMRIAGKGPDAIDAFNKPLWSKLDSVRIDSASKAAVVLAQDDDELLVSTLPGVAGCIVAKNYVESLSGRRFGLNPGPTTGRYSLCDMSDGYSATLISDGSWHGDPVGVDSAQFIVIPDDEAAQMAWKAGQIDVYRASPAVLDRWPTPSRGGRVVHSSTSRVAHLVLAQKGALANPELRRAVQTAINRDAVAKTMYGVSENAVANGLVPMGWAGWSAEPLFRYDPDEARSTAGSVKLSTPLRLATAPGTIPQRVAVAVAGLLSEVGISASVEIQEFPAYLSAIATDRADMVLAFGPPQNNDRFAIFENFSSTSPLRWASSPEFDKTLREARSSDFNEAALRLQNLLVQDNIAVPLIEDMAVYWIAEDLEPSFGPNGEIDLANWRRR